MEWTADVSAGDWIRERLEPMGPGWGATMHVAVPRGYPAYARILHRPSVSWVDDGRIPTQAELREMPMEKWPERRSDDTTWAATAAAFGTELHGTAQWNRIVRAADSADESGAPQSGDRQHVIGPDGREYAAPETGRLDAAQLAAAAEHLGAHTSTPGDAFVGVWDGWGGLSGYYGSTPATVVLSAVGDDDHRHREMLQRSIPDPFNNVFRKPVWQPGTLPDDASRGERLALPGREHILFRGAVSELGDPARFPWAGEHAWAVESPSIVWPADHAWVLATEVDFDSTLVAGSAELVRALCTDPRLEARALREGSALTWDADEVNR